MWIHASELWQLLALERRSFTQRWKECQVGLALRSMSPGSGNSSEGWNTKWRLYVEFCDGSIGSRTANETHGHAVLLWMQERVRDGDFSSKKVLTAKNCADVGTKPLSASALQQLCKLAGMVSYWSWMPHAPLQDDGASRRRRRWRSCSTETDNLSTLVVNIETDVQSWVKPLNGGKQWQDAVRNFVNTDRRQLWRKLSNTPWTRDDRESRCLR